KREEALAMFERAVEYSAQAYERAPHSTLWGRWFCQGLGNVANSQAALNQERQALDSYQRLVAVSRKRVFENPAITSLRGDLYKAHLLLGQYQRRLGNTDEAARSFRDAREVLENIPRETPDQLFALATVYASLARPANGVVPPAAEDAAEQRRNADLAVETLRKAIDAGYLNAAVVKTHTDFEPLRERSDFQQLISQIERAVQAQQLAARNQGRADQKLADRRQAIDLLKDLPASIRHRTTLAATLQSMGEIQTGLKQFAEAEKSLQDAIALWRELAAEQPDKPQLHVSRLSAQISLGNLYRESGRGAEAHRTWQGCLADLEQLRSQHPKDATLIEALAAREYQIASIYGRLGAFSFAADFARRNLKLRRIYRPILDIDAGIVLAMFDGDEALREICRLVDEERTRSGSRGWSDGELRNLGKVSSLVDPPPLPAAQSLEWIERAARAEPSGWNQSLLAMGQHRAGKSADALATIEKLTGTGTYDSLQNAGDKLDVCFAGALIAHGAGKTELARERLQKAEAIFVHYCQQTLQVDPVGLAPGLSTSGHWWEFTAPVLLRREAWRVIDGSKAPDEAWLRLIEARADHLLGDTARRDEQLAAADSRDVDVWVARARLAGDFDPTGQSAEAAWQRVVDLAGDDPLPWIQRGRWYAEHGQQEKADADFAKAAGLTPNELNKFLEAGWWVVGPYPQALAEFCPPEIDPDPSRPVYAIDPTSGLSDQ
ncbi:MAG TPA: hypothetical protein VML55_02585, partial [Planctomycetaceae bacterium]|nr:hypothetical protein [Planctomycetaceae bacterium]